MTKHHSNRLRRQRVVTAQHFCQSIFDPCLEFSTVKSVARGHWPALLTQLGISAETLRNHHGPCPGCGGVDRFRFDDRDGEGTFCCSGGGNDLLAGDGFKLLTHVHGWRPIEALRAVAEVLGLISDHSGSAVIPTRPVATATVAPHDTDKARTRFNALWSATVALDHSRAEPARRYLQQRGLTDLLSDLPHSWRFHPNLDYWHSREGHFESRGRFPALIAKIQAENGTPMGLHQTYLTAEGGKAAVPEPRKARSLYKGALRGAAIRLYPAQDRLALAEGIETALSLRVVWPEYPVWSCINASGLAGVQVPSGVAEVLIIADADTTGQRAAERLADRLTFEGRTARILMPDLGDLNDYFQECLP
ncbi:MAG TPA: toprim domain-containing protein [Candidatus Competibacteraceae bacterium]|nr:toprim domain-containing protein [Candidatus Competibacteraceae bacterium]